MWEGYVKFGNTEIINVQRVQKYIKNNGGAWFRPQFKDVGLLCRLLGDAPYQHQMTDHDTVPWWDPDDRESLGFWGVYPLSITGAEDSTRTAPVTQSTDDGGTVGRIRHGTRSIVFNVMLLGDDDASVDYGLKWLRGVLLSGTDAVCTSARNCSGRQLTYFYRNPIIGLDNLDVCYAEQVRYLRQVTINNGPSITAKHRLHDGSAVWEVQFTAVAAIPFEFGEEVPIMVDWFGAYPHIINPQGGYFDPDGYPHIEVPCDPNPYAPVFDPLCDQITLPPAPPSLSMGCFNIPKNWHRRQFQIAASAVPKYSDCVPVISVQARNHEIRNMRFRIWENDQIPDTGINSRPCDFIADYMISYIPSQSSLVINGDTETVEVLGTNGVSRPGESLVFDSTGGPFVWPRLTGGRLHVCAMDMTHSQVGMPIVNFSLIPRAY